MKRGPWIVVAASVVAGASGAACGSSEDSTFDPGGGADGGADVGADVGSPFDEASTTLVDGAGAEPPATDVEAVVTSDNAFSFGYGTPSALDTFVVGTASNGPEIFDCPVGFGPEPFRVPAAKAPTGAYLYIVAWADTDVTQGALAQFKRVGSTAPAIYSGDGNWQVCATGRFFPITGPGPDQAAVNAGLAACSAGATGDTYSKGWVDVRGAVTPGALGKLALGETNDTALSGGTPTPSNPFPIVCQRDDNRTQGIDPQARWMWFDPMDGTSPFIGNANNRTKTFLIFRLAAAALSIR